MAMWKSHAMNKSVIWIFEMNAVFYSFGDGEWDNCPGSDLWRPNSSPDYHVEWEAMLKALFEKRATAQKTLSHVFDIWRKTWNTILYR